MTGPIVSKESAFIRINDNNGGMSPNVNGISISGYNRDIEPNCLSFIRWGTAVGLHPTKRANITESSINAGDIILGGINTPVKDDDAANKAYVDSMAGGVNLQQVFSYTTTSTSMNRPFTPESGTVYYEIVTIKYSSGTSYDYPLVAYYNGISSITSMVASITSGNIGSEIGNYLLVRIENNRIYVNWNGETISSMTLNVIKLS